MTTNRTLMQKCYVIIYILRSTSLGIERKIATDEQKFFCDTNACSSK